MNYSRFGKIDSLTFPTFPFNMICVESSESESYAYTGQWIQLGLHVYALLYEFLKMKFQNPRSVMPKKMVSMGGYPN